MMRFPYLFVILFIFHSVSFSQTNDEVYVLQSFGTRDGVCRISNSVVDMNAFEELTAKEECARKLLPEEIDFENTSLITFHMRGDCFIEGSANVTVDRDAKKYLVHLNNYWGKCRAGGSFVGWVLIEKVPVGYTVDFEETKVASSYAQSPYKRMTRAERLTGNDETSIRTAVKSEEIDLKGCVFIGMRDETIILSESQYLSAIRKDAQSETCSKMAGSLDFNQYAYIGVNLNSGYCRRPKGLNYRVSDYGGSRKYVVNVTYEDPGNSVCRALSSYDLWLRVPNRSEIYSFVVRINQVPPSEVIVN